jgi:hypothetical protein
MYMSFQRSTMCSLELAAEALGVQVVAVGSGEDEVADVVSLHVAVGLG